MRPLILHRNLSSTIWHELETRLRTRSRSFLRGLPAPTSQSHQHLHLESSSNRSHGQPRVRFRIKTDTDNAKRDLERAGLAPTTDEQFVSFYWRTGFHDAVTMMTNSREKLQCIAYCQANLDREIPQAELASHCDLIAVQSSLARQMMKQAEWDAFGDSVTEQMRQHTQGFVASIFLVHSFDEGSLLASGTYLQLAGKPYILTNHHVARALARTPWPIS
jgi:hypothetical protein